MLISTAPARRWIALCVGLGLVVVASGCTATAWKSRWAMEHPEYRERYDDPYSDNRWQVARRKVKQAFDARFVDDDSGVYVGGIAGSNPGVGGAEIGVFTFPANWIELRGGLMGYGHAGHESIFFTGLNLGARVQTPTRLSAYAGLGTFLGGNSREYNGEFDGVDNDGDWFVDELGEVREESNYLMTIAPEAGLHYWLTARTRITAGMTYQISTLGRSHDGWTYGVWLSGATW